MADTQTSQESITGTLERIIFFNEKNAYCVAEISLADETRPTTILGTLPGVQCGETLKLNGEDVGIVNSPGYSHRMQKSLALCHIRPDAAVAGTKLEVVGEDTTYSAEVNAIPFYDPKKTRVRA